MRRLQLPSHELCAAYAAGQSTIVLARRYCCSPTTIAQHLRLCGMSLRRSRFAPIVVDALALRQLYLDDRVPITVIAAYFGVSVSTIGNKRRRYGIPPRPRRHQQAISALSQVASCV